RGMWRYVSIYDIVQIFLANVVSSAILFFIVSYWQTGYFAGFSRSVIILDFLICFFAVSGKRVLVRIIREASARSKEQKTLRTLIIGSTSAANTLIHTFAMNPGKREIIGILNDDVSSNMSIRGIPFLGKTDDVAKFAKELDISEILLLPPYSTPAKIKDIMERLENANIADCRLRMIPSYHDIAEGNIDVSNIRNVEIEDLLGRKPVRLDRTEVAQFVKGKSILVTGAGGSIGSELCRQIAAYCPKTLVLLDISEFNLYEIDRKLRNSHPDLEICSIIADVRNYARLLRAMEYHKVEIVYHAAAYKHVPLMEANPLSAIEVNVIGSDAVVRACEDAHTVKRMIMISTDKAVCPTSVMGASKRLAERIILERPAGKAEFVVVRFGNVLDSSGSVIPLFKEQIRNGGPVTVTSENVTRYFMSIPEAVDLVLQAGVIGHDRDIMVLDMGEPVRIYDMAKKLIELSGFVPDKDIKIKVIGLRPGEKEYEELLADEEKVSRTPFDRICVARKDKIPSAPPVDVSLLRKLCEQENLGEIRKILKTWIPENKLS
ncbi:MAG: nucleoside-diphosphate sugar epimerase/dehydratase, partial [Candidatus Nanoarchaeia archaeon]